MAKTKVVPQEALQEETAAQEAAASTEVPTYKIRMNVSIASETWSFYPGQIITAGTDIEETTARAWLECGHASTAE